ncbi:MAG TPA: hypothetical protein PLD95_04210 [bacterium]|jgi:hypothetical protein|nr:hypothetical protein [bacterium]HOG38641.1 hypothetical protein [bacterium]HQI03500.1 hypothetical protein [bacterium]
MDKNTKTKISKIQKIKNDYLHSLNSVIKDGNKKIEEIIKKDDEQRIKDILNNLK